MANPITPEQLAASGTEDGEQAALFCYAVEAARHDYRWGLMFAIPNGGLRSKATASNLKKTGVKRGVPDVMLPTAMGGFHGLYIEMKTMKTVGKRGQLIGGGIVEDEQEAWHNALLAEGYCVAVCYGWLVARGTVNLYLSGVIERTIDTRFPT